MKLNGMGHLLTSLGVDPNELTKAVMVVQQVGVKFANIEKQLQRIEENQHVIMTRLDLLRESTDPAYTPEINYTMERAALQIESQTV